jgi:hypothetical protein
MTRQSSRTGAEIRNSRRLAIGHPANPVSDHFAAGEFRTFSKPSVRVQRERVHSVILQTILAENKFIKNCSRLREGSLPGAGTTRPALKLELSLFCRAK